MGNITSKTVAGVTSTYTYDPSHPYAVDSVTNVNGGTYTASYDADGNMITRDGNAITWTTDNLPASISGSLGSSTFNYDPDHNRYYQTASLNGVSTDTTYIAGGLFEVVATSSGTTEYRHAILADGQVVAVHTIAQGGNASTAYLHYDHLGSVDTITNDSGSVIQQMSFDAFGQRRLPSSWDYGVSQATLATLKNYTDRGYTDEEELDNLSLVDLNGRVYDPTVGRFISADPTGGSGMGRYTYVGDNPLEFTDPTGFACKDGSANGINGPCGSVVPTTPLLPIGVNAPLVVPPAIPYFPIGGNTGEPGTTNLGDCDCVENTPNNTPSSGPSPGGNPNTSPASAPGTPIEKATNNTIALASIVNAAVRVPYFTVHPFNNIWSYFTFTFTNTNAFLNATPNGYSRLAIRGLEIRQFGENSYLNLPILSFQRENLILEEFFSLSNPLSSLFSSQDLDVFTNVDGLFHADIFQNYNGNISVSGYFGSPNDGNLGPDPESGDMGAFYFGPLIPSSQININPPGFGPGTYNLINHNCQSYVLCALGSGD